MEAPFSLCNRKGSIPIGASPGLARSYFSPIHRWMHTKVVLAIFFWHQGPRGTYGEYSLDRASCVIVKNALHGRLEGAVSNDMKQLGRPVV